ncbi:MAG: winged helix-turn-helix domain-containing protein [Anaerolineae bacterium]|nr:winged helix-turn-helix domain-containing protein [Anaerolineae bacterium]
MRKRTFKLNEKQIGELWRAFDDCNDSDTKIRYQAVRLYGTHYPLPTILEATGCSESSLREWVRTYRTVGLEGLIDHRTGGNSAKLTRDQRHEVEVRLHQFSPHQILGTATHSASGQFWTVADLEVTLRRWYGVQYQSRNSYYNLLHACGFSFQRAEKVFKSQRPAEIAAFQEMVEKNLSTRHKPHRRR